MAKKAVTVDEEALKGMIIGDMPVFGLKHTERPVVPADGTPAAIPAAPGGAEQTDTPRSESRPKTVFHPGKWPKEEPNNYQSRYLVPTTSSLRSQTYINKEVYDRIKRFLPVIAPEASISGYISNILAEHLERYAKEINELYEKQFEKPL